MNQLVTTFTTNAGFRADVLTASTIWILGFLGVFVWTIYILRRN